MKYRLIRITGEEKYGKKMHDAKKIARDMERSHLEIFTGQYFGDPAISLIELAMLHISLTNLLIFLLLERVHF